MAREVVEGSCGMLSETAGIDLIIRCRDYIHRLFDRRVRISSTTSRGHLCINHAFLFRTGCFKRFLRPLMFRTSDHEKSIPKLTSEHLERSNWAKWPDFGKNRARKLFRTNVAPMGSNNHF